MADALPQITVTDDQSHNVGTDTSSPVYSPSTDGVNGSKDGRPKSSESESVEIFYNCTRRDVR